MMPDRDVLTRAPAKTASAASTFATTRIAAMSVQIAADAIVIGGNNSDLPHN